MKSNKTYKESAVKQELSVRQLIRKYRNKNENVIFAKHSSTWAARFGDKVVTASVTRRGAVPKEKLAKTEVFDIACAPKELNQKEVRLGLALLIKEKAINDINAANSILRQLDSTFPEIKVEDIIAKNIL